MNATTTSGYAWNAADYSNQSHAQAAWADEVIARLDLQPAEHVLDIGSGDGKITAQIAECVPHGRVVGADSSAAMIAFANERFGGNGDRLTFRVMDASALTFRDEFDAVFSNAALHWIHDHAPVLRGIHAALRSGGRLRMQMGGRGNAAEVIEVVDEVRGGPRWSPYFEDFSFAYSFYGPDEYSDWLADAGLIPEHVELVSRPMRHAPEQFAGWLATTWMPYTSRIPEPDRATFIHQIVRRFIERFPPRADGILTVPMIRLNVNARKERAVGTHRRTEISIRFPV